MFATALGADVAQRHGRVTGSLFITDTEPKLFLRNSRGVQNGKPINLELYASGNAKDEQLWFISRGGEITFDRHNPHSPGDSRSRNPSNSNGADRPGPRYKENIPVPKFFLSNNTSLAFYVAETLSSIQTAITSDMSAGWSFAESKDDFKKDVVSILGSLQMSDQVRYLIGEVLGQTQLVSSFSTIGTLLPPPPPAILPPPPTSQELSEVKAQVAEIQKTLKAIEERSANLDSVVMDAARNAVQLYSDSLKQSKTSMQQAQPTGLQHPLVYPPSFPEPDYTPTQAVNEEWPQSLPICCPECAKNKSLHESASCTTDGPLPLV